MATSTVISVQHMELNTSTATTVSGILIYGQDTSNCVPFVTAHCAGADNIQEGFFDVYFGVDGATGSGNVTFELATNGGNNKHIHAYIVEFDPSQVKVQQGTFSIAAAATTDDIILSGVGLDSVDDGYAAMTHYYKSSTGTDNWSHHCVRNRITGGGTNVQFVRSGTSGNIDGHYYIFEALGNESAPFSVQGELTGNMSGVATAYQAIDWVNWPQTFILGSYHTSAGNDCQQGTVRMSLMTPTEIQMSRSSSTNNIWWSLYVISFNSDRKHVQRWFKTLDTGTTSATVDLDYPVDLDYSIPTLANRGGIQRHNGTTTSDPDAAFFSVKFNSSSQIEIERNSVGSGQNGYTHWEVIDWLGAPMVSGTNPSPLNSTYSCVKSVERVTFNIDNYYADTELTLGQDVTKCVPFLSQRGSSPGDEQWTLQRDVWFTAPSLVSARRRQSTGNLIVEANIVEFYPNQVRVEQGIFEIEAGNTEDLVTISGGAVDLTKAALVFNYASNSNSTAWSNHMVRGRFSSDTQLQFYRAGTTGDIEGHYYIFEDLADNFEVESDTFQFSTSANAASLLQNELKWHNSFTIYSYYSTTGADDMDRSTIAGYWSGIHRFYAHRSQGINNVYVALQAVRFLDDRLHTYTERPSIGTSDSTYSGTLPFHCEGHDDSLIAFCSDCGGTGAVYTIDAGGISEGWASVTLRDSSYWFNVQRNSTGYTGYYPFTFIDWVGYKQTLPATATATQSFVRSITHKTVSLESGAPASSGVYYVEYLDNGQVPENCIPLVTMRATGTSGEHRDIIPGVLIYTDGSNQIHIHRGGGTGTSEVNIYIVEFDPAQVKVQSGSFYMTGTSVTKYIEDVDLDRAFVFASCYCPSADAGWDTHMVRTRFTSVSGVAITRFSDPTGNDAMYYGYYYVVEALGDQFKVYDITFPNNDASTSLYADYPEHQLDIARTMFIVSYQHEQGSNVPANAAYRFYTLSDERVTLNKDDASGQLNQATVYGIEFNENLGVRILSRYADSLTGSETTLNHTFYPTEAFDTNRSIVHNPIVQNTARNDDTVASATEAGFHRMYFNTISGTGVTTDRYATSTPQTWPAFQVIEFPEYKTHYFEGIVQEEGSEVAREVVAYRADTYEIMDSTTSTVGTGAYRLETSYSGTHYIVCLDNTDPPNYNDLILGKMVPTPIT